MRIPVVRGVIDRRILVNYHVDPNVLAPLLPAPFRPKVIHGVGLVGICLIRLKKVRPSSFPSWLGISSENAAHRTAVEWDDHGVVRDGVYVRRRDTNSRLNSLAGGRVFPGVHHHTKFTVRETADRFEVAVCSDDGAHQNVGARSSDGTVAGVIGDALAGRSLGVLPSWFAWILGDTQSVTLPGPGAAVFQLAGGASGSRAGTVELL